MMGGGGGGGGGIPCVFTTINNIKTVWNIRIMGLDQLS